MNTRLALLTTIATLALSTSAQAHLSFYDCDVRRDICASNGSCERYGFDMIFAINDLAGSAAIINGANYTPLTPVYGAGTGLHFELMGQQFRFDFNDFGALRVTTAVSVGGEAQDITFVCAGET